MWLYSVTSIVSLVSAVSISLGQPETISVQPQDFIEISSSLKVDNVGGKYFFGYQFHTENNETYTVGLNYDESQPVNRIVAGSGCDFIGGDCHPLFENATWTVGEAFRFSVTNDHGSVGLKLLGGDYVYDTVIDLPLNLSSFNAIHNNVLPHGCPGKATTRFLNTWFLAEEGLPADALSKKTDVFNDANELTCSQNGSNFRIQNIATAFTILSGLNNKAD